MSRVAIDSGGRFSLGGQNFVIDESAKERRRSNEDAFTIVKSEPYLRV